MRQDSLPVEKYYVTRTKKGVIITINFNFLKPLQRALCKNIDGQTVYKMTTNSVR